MKSRCNRDRHWGKLGSSARRIGNENSQSFTVGKGGNLSFYTPLSHSNYFKTKTNQPTHMDMNEKDTGHFRDFQDRCAGSSRGLECGHTKPSELFLLTLFFCFFLYHVSLLFLWWTDFSASLGTGTIAPSQPPSLCVIFLAKQRDLRRSLFQFQILQQWVLCVLDQVFLSTTDNYFLWGPTSSRFCVQLKILFPSDVEHFGYKMHLW